MVSVCVSVCERARMCVCTCEQHFFFCPEHNSKAFGVADWKLDKKIDDNGKNCRNLETITLSLMVVELLSLVHLSVFVRSMSLFFVRNITQVLRVTNLELYL